VSTWRIQTSEVFVSDFAHEANWDNNLCDCAGESSAGNFRSLKLMQIFRETIEIRQRRPRFARIQRSDVR
jgi:hypothetical protein